MGVWIRDLRIRFAMQDRMKSALGVGVCAICTLMANAQPSSTPAEARFPNTAQLMAQVTLDQKKLESLLSQYTFTDKVTLYVLDKNGGVRSQHTDTYYITPTAYEFFTLHVSHDGKASSQKNLNEQQRKIEKQMKDDERKAQKSGSFHPKDQILFAEIIARSNFRALRWDQINGSTVVVYAFEPKSKARPTGNLTEKIAGDLKGKMWISPEEKEVLRIEFASVAPLSLGFLGNVKGFQGVTDQQKFHGELWMPRRQEYVAEGRELFKGFRIRQVSEFSDYLKATTDVFQQIHSPTEPSAQSTPQ